ncbi:hypothetical protein [Rhizobium leguminosarum]|uniref:hypothetical protein n=1 Tax=Rhizobium leguminosarum TaxID=384 RepID=UPI001C942158|nr:hypothetical protein [Rhizobium leguminosarum]MBY5439340.1 DUF3450 domain-containing protein [Rhizobium leguminosarum]
MHIKSSLLAAVFALVLILPAKADTVADILGVEKSINDLSKRAQETGDAVAKAFAEQMLRVIQEWKTANKELLADVKAAVDDETAKIFRQMDNTATRIEKGEAVAFIDLQRISASASSLVSRIPGASGEPQVTFSWPSIATPIGEPIVNVRILGGRIATANPSITSPDGKVIEVKKYSDDEIGFDLSRTDLHIEDSKPADNYFKLRYSFLDSHWYNPLSWVMTKKRDRDIKIKMLPKTAGSGTATWHTKKEWWEPKLLPDRVTLGGVGKDNLDPTNAYTLSNELQSQGWVIDPVAQETAAFDDNGGDGDGGSSCVRVDKPSITATSFRFLVQHGHKTDGLGRKSDAHQNCRVDVHVRLLHTDEKDVTDPSKPLVWNEPTTFEPAEGSVRYRIDLTFYDGTKYPVEKAELTPYGLYDVTEGNGRVTFRPRPQRDF